VSAVTRLIDLGVEPYLVASSLSAVLGQRLVRTCCAVCGGTGTVAETTCVTCTGSGYKGRTGLFELLTIGERLRAEISRGASLDDLRRLAHEEGMRTFAEEGESLINAGKTTRAEVERMIHHG
jgi:general secretion pathway protein E